MPHNVSQHPHNFIEWLKTYKSPSEQLINHENVLEHNRTLEKVRQRLRTMRKQLKPTKTVQITQQCEMTLLNFHVSFRTTQNPREYLKMLQNTQINVRECRRPPRSFQNNEKALKCHGIPRMLQNASKPSGTFQNRSELLRTLQNTLEYLRTLKNSSDPFQVIVNSTESKRRLRMA